MFMSDVVVPRPLRTSWCCAHAQTCSAHMSFAFGSRPKAHGVQCGALAQAVSADSNGSGGCCCGGDLQRRRRRWRRCIIHHCYWSHRPRPRTRRPSSAGAVEELGIAGQFGKEGSRAAARASFAVGGCSGKRLISRGRDGTNPSSGSSGGEWPR